MDCAAIKPAAAKAPLSLIPLDMQPCKIRVIIPVVTLRVTSKALVLACSSALGDLRVVRPFPFQELICITNIRLDLSRLNCPAYVQNRLFKSFLRIEGLRKPHCLWMEKKTLFHLKKVYKTNWVASCQQKQNTIKFDRVHLYS